MSYARTCGWCQTSTIDETLTNCTNCGGPLPPAAMVRDGVRTLTRGNAPPPAPRSLPGGYQNEILYTKNILFILGFVFAICLGWTCIFGLIGAPMLYLGWTRSRAKLLALIEGKTAQGVIDDVSRDGSVQVNGKNPWKIEYHFDAEGQRREGWVHAWKSPPYEPRDPVWVVYGPQDATKSCLWPPVR